MFTTYSYVVLVRALEFIHWLYRARSAATVYKNSASLDFPFYGNYEIKTSHQPYNLFYFKCNFLEITMIIG